MNTKLISPVHDSNQISIAQRVDLLQERNIQILRRAQVPLTSVSDGRRETGRMKIVRTTEE